MDSLRLVLLLIGLAIIALVYLFSRPKRRGGRKEASELEQVFEKEFEAVGLRAERQAVSEEQLSGLSGIKPSAGPAPLDTATASPDAGREAPEPTLLVLTVMSTDPEQSFSGTQLADAFERLGFELGQMDVYHCLDAKTGQSLFGIANIIEPGHLRELQRADFSTPGLALFLALPTVMEGGQAFALMLDKARHLSAMLEGRLCDQQRQTLDETALQRLKDQAASF